MRLEKTDESNLTNFRKKSQTEITTKFLPKNTLVGSKSITLTQHCCGQNYKKI
jgi:hypothetical protein